MNNMIKLAMALAITSFIASTPVIAAETTTQAPAVTQQSRDLSGALKDKASKIVDEGKQKVDKKAEELQNMLGKKSGAETVDVNQETVTVQTPDGVAQETTTVITPETPTSAPAAPATR